MFALSWWCVKLPQKDVRACRLTCLATSVRVEEVAESAKKATLVGPRSGVRNLDPQDGSPEYICSYNGLHFGVKLLDSKIDPAEAGALAKNGFCEQVKRIPACFPVSEASVRPSHWWLDRLSIFGLHFGVM